MRKLTLATMFVSTFVGFSAWALTPTIPSSKLPSLTQESQHKVASKRITGVFTRSHYHRFDLNDAFSKKIFNRYIKQLDYRRNVLLQSDVDSLARYSTKFDDALKSGDLSIAYKIFNRVQYLRYQRFAYALSLLDKKINFNVANDSYRYDREHAARPKNKTELNELWRQQVKYDALNLKLTGKDWPQIVKVLKKRYNNAIRRLTQTNSEDVFQNVMNAFARSIDPHTSYLSPRNAERFQMDMDLSLEGIGAVLQINDDYIVIKSLIAGGPAAKSGKLASDDRIIGVGQAGKSIVDVIGWRLDDAVELIKGPKGSKVVLQILPKKGGSTAKPINVTIVRDKILLKDRAATSKIITPSTGTYAGRKVGVIKVPGFYINLSKDVAKELLKLKKAKVEGVVIDLRGDGGGALVEAILLTGLFIEEGPVVQIRDANGEVSQDDDTDANIAYSGPLSVIVDRNSASASEIFAAALQDYKRALIVGESTFGKGTVQQHKSLERIYDLYDKPIGHVQYTIAKFYRINGGSTQIKGVTPDISFPTALKPGEYGEAESENALPWDKVAIAHYKTFKDINAKLVKNLNQLHLKRIKKDVEFGYISQDIAEFKKDHLKTSISLVEKTRTAQRKKDDDKQLIRLNERRKLNGLAPVSTLDKAKDEVKIPDAFLDEAVDITLDMADSAKKHK